MNRKSDHIRICMNENVESFSTQNEPFARIRLIPEALPEINAQDIDTKCTFLNRSFSMPLLITGMTGGVEKGQQLNENLARAASEFGIPMGLGSLKLLAKDVSYLPLFNVRKTSPHVFLIGNIGLADVAAGVINIDDILRLIDALKLDAFAFHVNALQESIQPEGSMTFRN